MEEKLNKRLEDLELSQKDCKIKFYETFRKYFLSLFFIKYFQINSDPNKA